MKATKTTEILAVIGRNGEKGEELGSWANRCTDVTIVYAFLDAEPKNDKDLRTFDNWAPHSFVSLHFLIFSFLKKENDQKVEGKRHQKAALFSVRQETHAL